ncbi:hypothetical protein EJB05_40651, partial [Eragrostis curvula]
MALRLLAEVSPQDLLVALAELHSHVLGYVKSMALKCAVDLGIPDAMHRRGGAATLTDIATDAAVHPAKVADLRRLMELLSTTGIQSEPAVTGSLFEQAHGCSQWEMASSDATLNRILNDSMVADSKLFLEVIILDKGRVFRGLSSLIDVGGGHGAATQVIATAFPRIKCTVLDLPHVIGQDVTGDGNVNFVAGNMFESIPPANAVLLKHLSSESAE